ncbi:OZF protein, partial [Alcedo cyanopectus]|nr:OZF protein [Ceyx cyanopectus]
QCGVCQKSFSLKQNLLTHQRIHSGEKPFPCRRCGRRFREHRFLINHQRTHADRDRPGTGTDTGTDEARAGGSRSPEPREASGGPSACTRCGKSCGCRSGLTGHRGGEGGERPFACPDCGESFGQKGSLRIH